MLPYAGDTNQPDKVSNFTMSDRIGNARFNDVVRMDSILNDHLLYPILVTSGFTLSIPYVTRRLWNQMDSARPETGPFPRPMQTEQNNMSRASLACKSGTHYKNLCCIFFPTTSCHHDIGQWLAILES